MVLDSSKCELYRLLDFSVQVEGSWFLPLKFILGSVCCTVHDDIWDVEETWYVMDRTLLKATRFFSVDHLPMRKSWCKCKHEKLDRNSTSQVISFNSNTKAWRGCANLKPSWNYSLVAYSKKSPRFVTPPMSSPFLRLRERKNLAKPSESKPGDQFRVVHRSSKCLNLHKPS